MSKVVLQNKKLAMEPSVIVTGAVGGKGSFRLGKRVREEEVGAADERSWDFSFSVPADTTAFSLSHTCSSC